MPATGLGKVGELVKATGSMKSARARTGRGEPPADGRIDVDAVAGGE
ncbi:MAG TPA: hypothetical protein VGP64_10125 [Polyangia bacterium]|jgi:hypothetical protein